MTKTWISIIAQSAINTYQMENWRCFLSIVAKTTNRWSALGYSTRRERLVEWFRRKKRLILLRLETFRLDRIMGLAHTEIIARAIGCHHAHRQSVGSVRRKRHEKRRLEYTLRAGVESCKRSMTRLPIKTSP